MYETVTAGYCLASRGDSALSLFDVGVRPKLRLPTD